MWRRGVTVKSAVTPAATALDGPVLRILAFALAVALFCPLLLWAADRARQPVAVPLRLVVGLAAALIAWTGYTLASSDAGLPVSALVGGAAVVVAISYLGFRTIARRPVRPGKDRISLPVTKPRLGMEWTPFVASLGWGTRSRASRAHDRIRQFVLLADQLQLDPEHQSLVIALKRRVPELLVEWERCCVGASADERHRYSLRTLSILERLASEADQARTTLREDGDRAFDSLERYFAGFTKKGDGTP